MTHPQTVHYRVITAPDGVPLCVGEAGNPAGPPILFLAGFSQTQAVFTLQFGSDLARDYRLIGLDYRGHGSSGKPWAESAYEDSRTWADDVDAVLRALGARFCRGRGLVVWRVRHHGLCAPLFRPLAWLASCSSVPMPACPRACPGHPSRRRDDRRRCKCFCGRRLDLRAGIAYGHDFVRQMTARAAVARALRDHAGQPHAAAGLRPPGHGLPGPGERRSD